jgi:hypothetical protein
MRPAHLNRPQLFSPKASYPSRKASYPSRNLHNKTQHHTVCDHTQGTPLMPAWEPSPSACNFRAQPQRVHCPSPLLLLLLQLYASMSCPLPSACSCCICSRRSACRRLASSAQPQSAPGPQGQPCTHLQGRVKQRVSSGDVTGVTIRDSIKA